jgi:RHS repeat-associated protein
VSASQPPNALRGGTSWGNLAPIYIVNIADPTDVMLDATYDEWGNVTDFTSSTGAWPIPFGFAGGLFDEDTGLVRFGARDYDPEVGRWTAKDPILFAGGSTNLYEYVGGDAVNATDPTGLDDDSECGGFGEGLGQVLGVGPLDANTARQIANTAGDLAGFLYPGPENQGKRDGFRHCLAACELAKAIGDEQAEAAGDIHENFCPNNPKDRADDLGNNAIGRNFASGNCLFQCKEAADSGHLYGCGQ